MSNLSVNIKGLKELGQAMNSLEHKVRNSIGVKAMRKGGAVIRNQARANAPVLEHSVSHRKRGTLKKAISARTKIGENGSLKLARLQLLKVMAKIVRQTQTILTTGDLWNLAHLKCQPNRFYAQLSLQRKNKQAVKLS